MCSVSETLKVSSLTEEIVRRLKSTREELPLSYRMETLEDISQIMKNSGHSDQFMKRIQIAGISKYERKLKHSKVDTDNVLYKPLHQPSRRSVQRLKKKTRARTN